MYRHIAEIHIEQCFNHFVVCVKFKWYTDSIPDFQAILDFWEDQYGETELQCDLITFW